MINTATILGNLTKKPDVNTYNGKTCTRFTVAVNSGSGDNKKTNYINVVCWNALAENCGKYLDQGNKVCVTGSIATGSYEKDGVKHYTFDILANSVEFLTPKQTTNTTQSIDDLPIVDDDDMPF